MCDKHIIVNSTCLQILQFVVLRTYIKEANLKIYLFITFVQASLAQQVIAISVIIPTTIEVEISKSIQNRRKQISAGIRNYAEIRSGIPEGSSTVSYAIGADR